MLVKVLLGVCHFLATFRFKLDTKRTTVVEQILNELKSR